VIRQRGVHYHREGRVTLTHQEPGLILAVVQGTQPYSVTIEFEGPGEVRMGCNCPYSQGRGVCKHLYAVLLAAEEAGEAAGAEEAGPAGPLGRAPAPARLRAGGYGLNLTTADYVFLLDPWWNPAVEAQAIDRTHRIGQTKPVVAMRFIARDTVEEKVLELQQTKRELADAVLGENQGLLSRITREDLELLLA